MTGFQAVRLVARREITQRIREKSFLTSLGVSLAIVVLVAVVPPLLGLGGKADYTVGTTGGRTTAVAATAVRGAGAFDAEVTTRAVDPAGVDRALRDGDVDAVLTDRGIRAKERPDDALVNLLRAADRQVRTGAALRDAGLSDAEAARALSPPPLTVSTIDAADPDADKRQGLAYIAVIILYGQLIGFGYIVASGVVEEKASRVVEILLSTLRPWQLLAGKIIGLGLLGLGQLVVLAVIGLAAAGGSGALPIDGDVVVAVLITLAWFVVGYGLYACLFATAASLVPRQEELQSVMTPMTLVLLVSFFLSFAALDDPDGSIAVIGSFVPPAAPLIMPPRVALGAASAGEIVGSLALCFASMALLVPLAARIYSGAVLRTGSAIKLRDAWRATARGTRPADAA
jgi:ABC-2 type transport system permease protein